MSRHPGEGLPGCPLDAAFGDLSAAAFALWIRLMTLPRRDLEGGQLHLGRLLGWSRRAIETRLRELKNKGYIRLTHDARGYRRQVVVLHRALISGPSQFVML